ncbi:MAG: hypothetical protein ACT4QG_03015 [Sporichthyaceae bacterium]
MTTTYDHGQFTGLRYPDFEVVVRGYDRKAVAGRIDALKRERAALDRRAAELEKMLAAGSIPQPRAESSNTQSTGLGKRIESMLQEAYDAADREREISVEEHREAVDNARHSAAEAVARAHHQAQAAEASAELEGNRLIDIARREAERIAGDGALKAARIRAEESVVLDAVYARVEQRSLDCETELAYAAAALDRELEAKAVAERNAIELATLEAQAMRDEALQMAERARRQADALLASSRDEARRLSTGAAEDAERLRVETRAAVGEVETAMEELGAVLAYQRAALLGP